MTALVPALRDLDRLVHLKVYKRKGKPPNYRVPKRVSKLILRMRKWRVRIEVIIPPEVAAPVTVSLQTPHTSQTTTAQTQAIALCVAAVRWKSLGLFPHDLAKRLGVAV